MPITKNPKYIKEPTDLQCGQAVLAMLCDKTVGEVVTALGNERETTLAEMKSFLDREGVRYCAERKQVFLKKDLPNICVLSLETPRCWHWSLYFFGVFYDPEHGVSNDFPECERKYFWEIY